MCGGISVYRRRFISSVFTIADEFQAKNTAEKWKQVSDAAVIAAAAADRAGNESSGATMAKGCYTFFFCVICRMTAAVPTHSDCHSLSQHTHTQRA